MLYNYNEAIIMKVGEKIFYPMHGAGIVKNIEKKIINNEEEKFYIIEIPYEQNLRIYINEKNILTSSYRKLLDIDALDDVYNYLNGEEFPMAKKWSKRYKENMERLKSLNLYDIAYVLKGLSQRSKKQKLSIKEIFMLSLARRILVSEFIMASGFSKNKIDKIIDFTMKN